MRTLQTARLILAICTVVGWGLAAPCCAYSQPAASTAIDFATQIKPILAAKCYSCHSPSTLQGGGVRLDQGSAAKSGGYSRRPLLGGTLETNEIYRRVTSTDPTYLMPKGGPPLSDNEISHFRRWVEAGTPWPDETQPESTWQTLFDREAWLKYGERWLQEVPGFIVWVCVLLVLQIGFLLVERYKRAVSQQRPWTSRPRARWLSPLKYVGPTHYLLIVLAMCLALSILVILGMQTQLQRLNDAVGSLRGKKPTDAAGFSTFTVYGNPPQPIRPNHPPRLSGIYYRGNCERHPTLFNGGNYRTATLQISLIDKAGHKLDYGDRVTPGEVWIRFEMERAKGTTEELFGEGIANAVFLTTQPLTEMMAPLKSSIERVRTTKPSWKWEATYPISVPDKQSDQSLAGLVYVYHGTAEAKQARGTLHFGIRYQLHLKGMVLQPSSELWMGSLFWSAALEHPNQGRIPQKQWFDYEPIPEVTGKNSTDPKLLGIPEHKQTPDKK